jgi:enediyne biosynthesis protein E4
LFLAAVSALATWLAGQATQPVDLKPAPPRVKPGEVHFEDIAKQAGLNALNVYGGDAHKEFIIETTGNGAIIFDYDNDGWPDIFLPNGSTVEGFPKDKAPTGHLYHNNHDGTFTDVTAQAGLARAGSQNQFQ